jgi:hypothetical protein
MIPTKDLDAQTEALHQAGKLKERDYQIQTKLNHWFRQWEANFIRWASDNAIVVESR